MLLSATRTIQTRKDRYFSDKDMRKTVSILLAVLFVFTVTACKKKEQKVSSSSVISDVPVTYADTSALERDFGFKPSTSLREGLRKFAEWYKAFYQV